MGVFGRDTDKRLHVAQLNAQFAAGSITHDEMARQIQQLLTPGTQPPDSSR